MMLKLVLLFAPACAGAVRRHCTMHQDDACDGGDSVGVTPSLDSSERGKHHTLESWPGVAEENILNMNAINYGLVHGNQVSQKIFHIHRQSTKCIMSSFASYEFLWNIPT